MSMTQCNKHKEYEEPRQHIFKNLIVMTPNKNYLDEF